MSGSTKTLTLCKAFLEKVDAQKQQDLVRHLSPKSAEIIRTMPPIPLRTFASLADPERVWSKIHPTWIAKALKNGGYSDGDQLLLLSAIPESSAAVLLGKKARIPLNPAAATYFAGVLYKQVVGQQAPLPEEILPSSPHNALLDMSREQLIDLISLLGIHDLARDLTTLLDATKIRAIVAALTPTQSAYLEGLKNTAPEPITFPKLPLQQWINDVQQLQGLILQRGINRLAKVMAAESEELLAHLLLALPEPHYRLFMGLKTTLEERTMTRYLSAQVSAICKILIKSAEAKA